MQIDLDNGTVHLDRQVQFVGPNGHRKGFEVHADFTDSAVSGWYQATAIRESGATKTEKDVRFSYFLPVETKNVMECWVITPKVKSSTNFGGHLRNSADDCLSSFLRSEVVKILRRSRSY